MAPVAATPGWGPAGPRGGPRMTGRTGRKTEAASILEIIDILEWQGFQVSSRYGNAAQTKRRLWRVR